MDKFINFGLEHRISFATLSTQRTFITLGMSAFLNLYQSPTEGW